MFGPIFIDGNLTGQKYLDIINNTVVPELRRLYGQQRNEAIPRIWYIQDGAGPHRARAVHGRLEELFPNRVVGLDPGVRSRSGVASEIAGPHAPRFFSLGIS